MFNFDQKKNLNAIYQLGIKINKEEDCLLFFNRKNIQHHDQISEYAKQIYQIKLRLDQIYIETYRSDIYRIDKLQEKIVHLQSLVRKNSTEIHKTYEKIYKFTEQILWLEKESLQSFINEILHNYRQITVDIDQNNNLNYINQLKIIINEQLNKWFFYDQKILRYQEQICEYQKQIKKCRLQFDQKHIEVKILQQKIAALQSIIDKYLTNIHQIPIQIFQFQEQIFMQEKESLQSLLYDILINYGKMQVSVNQDYNLNYIYRLKDQIENQKEFITEKNNKIIDYQRKALYHIKQIDKYETHLDQNIIKIYNQLDLIDNLHSNISENQKQLFIVHVEIFKFQEQIDLLEKESISTFINEILHNYSTKMHENKIKILDERTNSLNEERKRLIEQSLYFQCINIDKV